MNLTAFKIHKSDSNQINYSSFLAEISLESVNQERVFICNYKEKTRTFDTVIVAQNQTNTKKDNKKSKMPKRKVSETENRKHKKAHVICIRLFLSF